MCQFLGLGIAITGREEGLQEVCLPLQFVPKVNTVSGVGLMDEGTHADLENVRNFTQAGFFISSFCPKVRELCQLQNCLKTA